VNNYFKVLPQAVSYDARGLNINATGLIGLLIEAVKELVERTSENEKTITELKSRIERIENQNGITHALQLLHYESKDLGFYDWHTDTGNGEAATRKISVVIPLSSPSDYEGGALMINNMGNIIKAEQERGSISLFPSYIPHKVEPVTGGHRWSLVSWIHGSRRFR